MDHGRIRIRFPDAQAASRALAALAPDDPGAVHLEVDGTTLTVAAHGRTPMAVLRTLDDAMGCLRATGVP